MARKYFFLLICLILSSGLMKGQKKVLTFSDMNAWPIISDETISDDGNYISYQIRSESGPQVLVVQAADNSFKYEFKDASSAKFTGDNRFIIFKDKNDTLNIFSLSKTTIQKIPDVSLFKIPEAENCNWIAYCLRRNLDDVLLLDLNSGKTVDYAYTENFYFCRASSALILIQTDELKYKTISICRLDNTHASKPKLIWKGKAISGFTFDDKGSRMAFVENVEGKKEKIGRIWYYGDGMDSAVMLLDSESEALRKRFKVSSDAYSSLNLPMFSNDGTKLFFHLERIETAADLIHNVSVGSKLDIWKYDDKYLQSQQLKQVNNNKQGLIGLIQLDNFKKVVILDDYNTQYLELACKGDSNYALIVTETNDSEMNQDLVKAPSVFLVSLRDGSSELILKENPDFTTVKFSPKGKYLVWFDKEKLAFFSFSIFDRRIRNITKQIPFPIFDETLDVPRKPDCYGIAGWMDNDSALLIYDRYDIWQVDLGGYRPPVNITKGFGRRNTTIMRVVKDDFSSHEPVFCISDSIFLAGFNRITKDNGFFYQNLYSSSNPKCITFGSYAYYFPSITPRSFVSIPKMPVKAKKANIYLSRRMNALEYPNLFLIKDLKFSTQLTALNPQKNYNWVKTELIHWKTTTDKQAEGILYKPENFNPKNRYPIIFYYYEKLADGINEFLNPALSDGTLNIPYFVSNGYLVFVPDIDYSMGLPGESALSTVYSAAMFLSRYSWVDASKMGLQGHSFGGYETNYIISHTKLFKAAVSSAGVWDFISLYNSIRGSFGMPAQYLFEIDQNRMGVTLWKNPAGYIDNSPIFKANNITTPLLIMHNKNDGAVPWEQGIEGFLALRRLGKKVWMLQYDGEDHSIRNPKNQLDFSIRMKQFFDYYLKGTQIPRWISEGRPAVKKGVEDALDFDSTQKIP